MTIQEKADQELREFFQGMTVKEEDERTNENLQECINIGAARMAIFKDWLCAPTIPYISSLAGIYGRKTKRIIIYGAGGFARDTLLDMSLCGLRPYCFCDSDPKKWGLKLKCFDYPIISPEKLLQEHKDDYIVISSQQYMYNIFNTIVNMGISKENIFIPLHEPSYNINV